MDAHTHTHTHTHARTIFMYMHLLSQDMHQEAVIAYLATLKQNPKASHVWSYLRISLSYMKRDDLVTLTHKQDVSLFKPHFKF